MEDKNRATKRSILGNSLNGADNRSKTKYVSACIYYYLFKINIQVPVLVPVLVLLPEREQNRR